MYKNIKNSIEKINELKNTEYKLQDPSEATMCRS